MEMIQAVKKIEKEVIKSSGIDLVSLGFALFFVAVILVYSFLSSGSTPNNIFLAVVALYKATWIITVPAAALLSAAVYFMIRGMVL